MEKKIVTLAEQPNVYVKLGGLGMSFIRGHAPDTSIDALAEAWRPFIETSIEAFGPSRAIFESNYSVDRQNCPYARLWNVFKRIASACSREEKRRLFRDAACHFHISDPRRQRENMLQAHTGRTGTTFPEESR